MQISKVIKKKRIEKGLSPLQLSELLDVDFEDVLRWEEGSLEPSVDMLKRLALVFSMSIEAFFQELEEKIEEEAIEIVKEEVVLTTCLWCDNNFKDEELFQKNPYPLCLVCHKEKEKVLKSLTDDLNEDKEKLKKLTKKYVKNTLWLSYVSVIVLFFIMFPFLNKYNEYREYLFLGGLYVDISIVCFITLIHFKGIIYKATKGIIKSSLNYPNKLFKAKIKGIIWSLLIKVLFGAVLMVLSVASIIIFNLIIISLSPLFLPPTLIKYRRRAKYDYL